MGKRKREDSRKRKGDEVKEDIVADSEWGEGIDDIKKRAK